MGARRGFVPLGAAEPGPVISPGPENRRRCAPCSTCRRPAPRIDRCRGRPRPDPGATGCPRDGLRPRRGGVPVKIRRDPPPLRARPSGVRGVTTFAFSEKINATAARLSAIPPPRPDRWPTPCGWLAGDAAGGWAQKRLGAPDPRLGCEPPPGRVARGPGRHLYLTRTAARWSPLGNQGGDRAVTALPARRNGGIGGTPQPWRAPR